MALLVAHMASASIDLSLADAALLRDGLTALLHTAGYGTEIKNE